MARINADDLPNLRPSVSSAVSLYLRLRLRRSGSLRWRPCARASRKAQGRRRSRGRSCSAARIHLDIGQPNTLFYHRVLAGGGELYFLLLRRPKERSREKKVRTKRKGEAKEDGIAMFCASAASPAVPVLVVPAKIRSVVLLLVGATSAPSCVPVLQLTLGAPPPFHVKVAEGARG